MIISKIDKNRSRILNMILEFYNMIWADRNLEHHEMLEKARK